MGLRGSEGLCGGLCEGLCEGCVTPAPDSGG